MIGGDRVLALVPARSGSKGLPGKNIRPLHGKPLLAWPIEAAKQSRYIDSIVVSTDSAEFADCARSAGARVPFLRPVDLAADTVPSISVILHALDHLAAGGDQYEYLVLLEPTSPLTEATDVDAALEKLAAARPHADAIVSVTELVSAHPAFAVRIDEHGIAHPFSGGTFGQLPRRQEVETLFGLDGSFYISSTAALRAQRGFCHARTLAQCLPRYKSFEVDDLVDFVCIEAILAQRDLILREQ